MALLSDYLSPGGNLVPERTTEVVTATAGQAIFNLTTIEFRKGYKDLAVAINGVRQPADSSSYTENTTSQITLSEGVKAGDQLTFSITRLAPA